MKLLLGNYDWNAYDELIDNLSFNWYIDNYWTVKGQFSVTKQYSKAEKFIDPLSSKTSVYGTDDKNLSGDLYTTKGESINWNANAFLYYTRTFKEKHNLNVSFRLGRLLPVQQKIRTRIIVVFLQENSIH